MLLDHIIFTWLVCIGLFSDTESIKTHTGKASDYWEEYGLSEKVKYIAATPECPG